MYCTLCNHNTCRRCTLVSFVPALYFEGKMRSRTVQQQLRRERRKEWGGAAVTSLHIPHQMIQLLHRLSFTTTTKSTSVKGIITIRAGICTLRWCAKCLPRRPRAAWWCGRTRSCCAATAAASTATRSGSGTARSAGESDNNNSNRAEQGPVELPPQTRSESRLELGWWRNNEKGIWAHIHCCNFYTVPSIMQRNYFTHRFSRLKKSNQESPEKSEAPEKSERNLRSLFGKGLPSKGQ